MPQLTHLRALFRSFANFAAFMIGALAGIAQLAGFSKGLGQIVLTAVGIACLLFLVIRFSLLYYVRSNGQLKKEVEEANQQVTTLQVGHQRYVDAIERIIDQEGPLYQETLEMTVTVGVDDAGDMIVERRRTVPRPRVTQRAFRPIVPTGDGRFTSMDDIDFEARLLSGPGNITPLPLVRGQRLRVWLVFDPGLTEPMEWQVEYRPQGLWAPLRRNGYDWLAWQDRLPTGNGGASVLTELVVRFVFPRGDKQPNVMERHGFGQFSAAHRIDGTGQWMITWKDLIPAGHRYEWDLTQDVRAFA